MNTPAPIFSVGSVLWSIFAALAVIVFITTLAYYYHWGKYSPTTHGAMLTIVIYTLGVAVLLIGMLGVLATV